MHFGVGCDGCGVFPIVGRRFCCADCSEAIGYDLCGRCYDTGLHKREAPSGRFNQAHKPEHRMEEMEQVDTWLHRLQRHRPHTLPRDAMDIEGAAVGPLALNVFQSAPVRRSNGDLSSSGLSSTTPWYTSCRIQVHPLDVDVLSRRHTPSSRTALWRGDETSSF